MMQNNIEISFYMETQEIVNMDSIANILNINNAGFCTKGEICLSKNKKIQYVSDISYYGFGMAKGENMANKIEMFFNIIESKKDIFIDIFNKFDFKRDIFIYTWPYNDEEPCCYELNTKKIQLIHDLNASISIIHYN